MFVFDNNIIFIKFLLLLMRFGVRNELTNNKHMWFLKIMRFSFLWCSFELMQLMQPMQLDGFVNLQTVLDFMQGYA